MGRVRLGRDKRTLTLRLTYWQWRKLRHICHELEMPATAFIRGLLERALKGVRVSGMVKKLKNEGVYEKLVDGVGDDVGGGDEVLLPAGGRGDVPEGGLGGDGGVVGEGEDGGGGPKKEGVL